MSATLLLSRSNLNPDEDFVLHGRTSSYWERPQQLSNSRLTSTTTRLSQQSIYNPDNYREKKEKRYAKSMVDLAHNLEYLSGKVSDTLTKGVTFSDNFMDHNDLLLTKKNADNLEFSKPSLGESLRTDITEDELLRLYEKKVGEIDSMGGKPISPRDSQWYVNPNHLETTGEAPTLQSISSSYRAGKTKAFDKFSDKDTVALRHFPVTLGSAYELCALDFPASDPMNVSAPPSMRRTRSKSASRLSRSKTFTGYNKFDATRPLDKMYLTTVEAPLTGSCDVYLTSPYQSTIGKLRLDRLRLEEAKLLELKRLEELERIRGPKAKWYESKGPDFHYEHHKNTEMIKCESQYQDLLDYREDLLRSSHSSLKKYGKQLLPEY